MTAAKKPDKFTGAIIRSIDQLENIQLQGIVITKKHQISADQDSDAIPYVAEYRFDDVNCLQLFKEAIRSIAINWQRQREDLTKTLEPNEKVVINVADLLAPKSRQSVKASQKARAIKTVQENPNIDEATKQQLIAQLEENM